MAVTISSGELRKKVVFKQPVSSLNDEGGQERIFTTAFETFAKVDKFNQFRGTEANVTDLTSALDFYIRWAATREAVNKDWLIEYNGEDYVIHQIEPVEQKQKFIRFTGKSTGNAVVSTNSESVGDYPSGGGSDPEDVDVSNMQLTFNANEEFAVVLNIDKNFLAESFIDWGDGNTEVIPEGLNLFAFHSYDPGQYVCKIYPENGVTIPTAPVVNDLVSVVISIDTPGADVTMEVGDSLSFANFMKFFTAQGWGMTTFPDLPDAGPEQIRMVNIPGANLNGAECSQILVQCDQIGWPVGYVDLTGSAGTSSLSSAGTAALASLHAKGWALYPWYP